MPRYYTIASSSLAYPNDLAIAISLTKMQTVKGEFKNGLTSGYYEELISKDVNGLVSRGFVKDSQFYMPKENSTPLIMVGPGTGVVPFIGFLQERTKIIEQNPEATLGEANLYFGCRQKETDYIYKQELESFSGKVLHKLNVAFSRPQQEEGLTKQYVQDLLKRDSETIVDIIKN